MRKKKDKRKDTQPATDNPEDDKGTATEMSEEDKKEFSQLIELGMEIDEQKRKFMLDLKRKSEEIEKPIVADDGDAVSSKLWFFKKKASSREFKKQEGIKPIDKLKLKMFRTQTFVIEMFFSNGISKTFTIRTRKEYFAFKGKIYYLRYEDSWFNLSVNEYKLYYNEDYCCPIDRRIESLPDKTAPEGFEKEYFTVTPSNIKSLMKYEYIKKITNFEDMNKYLKILLILVAINLLINVIKTLGIVKVT